MNQEQFLVKLRRAVKTFEVNNNHESFVVESNADIRCGDMCPITFLDGNGLHSDEYESCLDGLGMSGELAERIVDASDYVEGHSPALRRKLLKAVNLL